MKFINKLTALAVLAALLLTSCSVFNKDSESTKSKGSVVGNSTDKIAVDISREKAVFKSNDVKELVADLLNKDSASLTYGDLNQIIGFDLYFYSERVNNTNEYKPVWSVTVKKSGFDEVFDKYYGVPSEERQNLENPANYYRNGQFDSFDGYEDLKYFTALTELSLSSEYMLAEFDPSVFFENLTGLENLSVYNYVIPNLDRIGKFTKLRQLSIGINLRSVPDGVQIEYIEDMTPLKNLTLLENLSLNGNIISDLSPITGLDKITDLTITNAALGDISPVAEMKNLKTVTFYYNGIEDITPLTKIPGLEIINLDYNYINDVSPFANLDPEVVKYVSLDMNGITDDTPLKHLGKERINLGYDPYWDIE